MEFVNLCPSKPVMPVAARVDRWLLNVEYTSDTVACLFAGLVVADHHLQMPQ